MNPSSCRPRPTYSGRSAGPVATDPDVQQYDETGYIWTLREEARDPSLVIEGAILVAGGSEDPFLARVVDVLPASDVTKVHLEVLPGDPTDYIAALRRAHLLSAWSGTGSPGNRAPSTSAAWRSRASKA
jgi:hypothetical protein